MSPISIKHLL